MLAAPGKKHVSQNAKIDFVLSRVTLGEALVIWKSVVHGWGEQRIYIVARCDIGQVDLDSDSASKTLFAVEKHDEDDADSDSPERERTSKSN